MEEPSFARGYVHPTGTEMGPEPKRKSIFGGIEVESAPVQFPTAQSAPMPNFTNARGQGWETDGYLNLTPPESFVREGSIGGERTGEHGSSSFAQGVTSKYPFVPKNFLGKEIINPVLPTPVFRRAEDFPHGENRNSNLNMKRKQNSYELSNSERRGELGLPPASDAFDFSKVERDFSFSNSPTNKSAQLPQPSSLFGNPLRFERLDSSNQTGTSKSQESTKVNLRTDYTQSNFDKLSVPQVRSNLDVQPTKRAKHGLFEMLEKAAEPLVNLFKWGTPKPKEETPAQELKFDMNIVRFWASVSKKDIASLSAEAIYKYKQLFDQDVGCARRKLLERPLAAQFQLDRHIVARKSALPEDDTAGYLKRLREKAYQAYHPVIATLAESRNFLSCADPVIYKSLFSRLEAACVSIDKDNNDMISMWQVLGTMVGEFPTTNSPEYFNEKKAGTLKEPANLHCKTFGMFGHDNCSASVLNQRTILTRGSIHWLQDRFYQHIGFTLKDHLEGPNPLIQLGGTPDFDVYFDAYITLLFHREQRLDLLDNASARAWAHLFLLFRCGFYDRMLKYAFANQKLLGVAQEDSVEWGSRVPFTVLLSIFINKERFSLPRKLRLQLLGTYVKYLLDKSSNPFRLAFFTLLIRDEEEFSESSLIMQSREDLIWWSLILYQTEAGEDGISLKTLQSLPLNPGITTTDTLVYVRMLLLTQQFEEAVVALASKPALECEALHLACALIHYNLLRVPETPLVSSFELLVDDKKIGACLNIMQLFSRTLPWFTAMDPAHFMDYYSFLPLLPNQKYRAHALECIHNLFMGLGSFDLLVGPKSLIQCYKPNFGLVHTVLLGDTTPKQVETEWHNMVDHLTRTAAFQCMLAQNFTLAMNLYFSINDCDAGFQAFNSILGEKLIQLFKEWAENLNYLFTKRLPEHLIKDLETILLYREGLKLAKSTGIMYSKCQPTPSTLLDSERILNIVDLAESTFHQNSSGLFSACLDLGILPYIPFPEDIQEWEAGFQSLSPLFQKLLPLTMVIISNAIQYINPGVLVSPKSEISGFPMSKYSKINLLRGISAVAIHFPRIFPSGPPPSLINVTCSTMPCCGDD